MKKPDKNLTAGERRLAESKETPRGSQSRALEKAKPVEYKYASKHADDAPKPKSKSKPKVRGK